MSRVRDRKSERESLQTHIRMKKPAHFEGSPPENNTFLSSDQCSSTFLSIISSLLSHCPFHQLLFLILILIYPYLGPYKGVVVLQAAVPLNLSMKWINNDRTPKDELTYLQLLQQHATILTTLFISVHSDMILAHSSFSFIIHSFILKKGIHTMTATIHLYWPAVNPDNKRFALFNPWVIHGLRISSR